MALLGDCFCCSLGIASGFFAVYLLIAYLIAFAFELLWILESAIALPTAAVLLCTAYFSLAIFAAILIHGLANKSTVCLLSWMFAVTILTFPEAGMVIYMSIQYWRIESLYGITELACWLARIIANVVEVIIVQSLYSTWKDEEIVNKRLRDLNMTAMPIPRESLGPLNSQFYQNNAYENSLDQLNVNGLKRTMSTPQIWNTQLPNNMTPYAFDGYQFYTTQSEFNASVFVPNYAASEMQLQPSAVKKAQSLMDLRFNDVSSVMVEKIPEEIADTTSAIIPNYALSLDRKLIHQRSSPRLPKYASVDALNNINSTDGTSASYVIRNRTGFYAQPLPNYGVPIYYGPLDGPDFLIYKKQMDKLTSRNSLSNASAEDVQKYRDVQL